MKKALSGLSVVIIAVIVVLALSGGVAGAYNSLVSLNEKADTAWAQVETVYQRRLDLVPNLTNATRGFLRQEQALYEKITQARAQYSGARGVAERVSAGNELEGALSRLLVLVEQNPEIKSNQTVSELMAELAGTENRISVERRRFNEAVLAYNLKVKRFPSNLVAAAFNYDERVQFESAEGAETVPAVDLGLE